VNAREQDLIDQARLGDLTSFEALVDRYAVYVFNLALRVVGDSHEAENLTQEAFLRAWRGLPGFQGRAKFSTWLYQIVTNLCNSRLPRLRLELSALTPEEDALQLPDERQFVEASLLSKELQTWLHAAVDRLPVSYRLLISLRYLQELSYAEIAQMTGLPLGTVKTGIHRARHILKEALERYESE
jgi:RNA polymerase sigma-70 factor (ECF subfamily)